MQEKGMQNDPRYPQLMAMANKAKQYAHMEGMASQDNMGGPPDRNRGKRPSVWCTDGILLYQKTKWE